LEPETTNSESLSGARRLVEELAEARAEQDRRRQALTEQTEKVDELEKRIISTLEAAEMDRLDAAGHYVLLGERTSVKTPKNNAERELFFEYLKEKGVYEDLRTVNSQSLNAFYKSELELALGRGELDFSIPGITEVLVVPKLSLRKK
jgi:hypothetical protein